MNLFYIEYHKHINSKYLYLLVICMAFHFHEKEAAAQDLHFTQFFTTPMLTNPANTAMFDDNFRFASNYRNQWSQIGVPYRTFYASLDEKLTLFNQSFGIGGMIVHDQTAYNLTGNEILLSFSYSKIINNQQFTIGIQPGYAMKSYNLSSLTFGSQFDASSELFNSNLSSNESLAESLNYFDLNLGVFWRTSIHSIMPSAGFSVRHVLKPTVTYTSTSSTTTLPLKFTFNSQVIVPIDDKVDITPSMLWGYTSGSSELLLGCIEGYKINKFRIPVKKIYAINMFRVNPLSNIDAFILGVGVKFQKFDMGITYDYNVSSLAGTSNFNGAFEISFIYTGGNNKKNGNEPCFIY